MITESVALCVLGVIIGYVLANIVTLIRTKTGTLKIDRHNPEKDIYRLDITDLDSIKGKKILLLKIDDKADLSQK